MVSRKMRLPIREKGVFHGRVFPGALIFRIVEMLHDVFMFRQVAQGFPAGGAVPGGAFIVGAGCHGAEEGEVTEVWGIWKNPERVFQRRRFAFLRFLAHIIEQGGVAGQVQQAHLPVAVGVQGCLQAAQGQRAVAEHLAAPGERFLLQVLQGNHGIDQAHVQRLPGIVLPAQVPDFPRFFWPTMRAR